MGGTGIYSIGEDGRRNYATPINEKINDEELYTFDSERGLPIKSLPKPAGGNYLLVLIWQNQQRKTLSDKLRNYFN